MRKALHPDFLAGSINSQKAILILSEIHHLLGFFTTSQSGPYSRSTHLGSEKKKVRKGDIEATARHVTYKHYTSNQRHSTWERDDC
ncbi:hypothetical protein PCANC_12239 [Puccinia coronata f. sp. avenae]|uniref:Uncharacterized protein n=1 Tax=Puccinia coronata f. sp. avenae TaxID=200324 RepID=A0A2N5SJQ6_9BASI|nr:hypothetical protein PCANC_15603 [Puccinia coronata f. sp. avenae]PLW34688.1 hypothetical protein PCANC_12239 [Puccinia coronata f. sp. avenae]